MPFKSRKAVFDRLEQMASKANMTVAERQQYEEEWKNANDYYNTLDYAKKEAQAEGHAQGLVEGRTEGKAEMVRNLKQLGVSTETIQQASGLSFKEIEEL